MGNEDADIDALMSSVVGRNGEIVEFPATVESRARVKQVRAVEKVAELSGDLIDELESNEAERAIVDPRTVPARFSNLKHMSRSARHYWDAVQLDRDDTLAMRLGRGAHAMVLGMPVIQWTGKTRNGKAWDAFKAQHADKEILNRSEWAKSVGIAEAIKRHPIAAPLLFNGTTLEETIEWELMGKKCTSRPDARKGTEYLVDLKTTQCAEPDKFQRDSMYRGYNAQLVFYEMAVEAAFGVKPPDSYVVAVESKRPYAITVMKMTDRAREQGERLCRLWFERLLVCEQSDHWPEYVDSITALDVPGDDNMKITIDGEDFAFDA